MSKGGFARAAQALAPRVAQSFFKIDRSTTEAHDGQNTFLRSAYGGTFIIRPARNALKLVRGKFNHLIYKSKTV